MPHLEFPSASEWLDAVKRRVGDPEVVDGLAHRGMSAATVVEIARIEAEHTGPTGAVTLVTDELARVAGVPPAMARRARVALIAMGAQVFIAVPGASHRPARQLQLPVRR
ncbi:hypothetical protein ACFVU2_02285 [Leifsonia sp. NPDC058194]|uniref:hypothetical protein n=1 Tax=Leifsonia sp. NPDC058194 TaxID=3346374 RepID=UPI0036D88398